MFIQFTEYLYIKNTTILNSVARWGGGIST